MCASGEMADALRSGRSDRKVLEVQVLSRAPLEEYAFCVNKNPPPRRGVFLFCFWDGFLYEEFTSRLSLQYCIEPMSCMFFPAETKSKTHGDGEHCNQTREENFDKVRCNSKLHQRGKNGEHDE